MSQKSEKWISSFSRIKINLLDLKCKDKTNPYMLNMSFHWLKTNLSCISTFYGNFVWILSIVLSLMWPGLIGTGHILQNSSCQTSHSEYITYLDDNVIRFYIKYTPSCVIFFPTCFHPYRYQHWAKIFTFYLLNHTDNHKNLTTYYYVLYF